MNIQINNQQSAISNQQFAKGFSLMEVLLAVGILAVGMLFIAGVFPVGIYFTTVASERTIAATAADEAFAKVVLLAHDPLCPLNAGNFQNPYSASFEEIADANRALLVPLVQPIPADCFAYPSTPSIDPTAKKYWWSAVCRRVDLLDPCSVQATVFISRKAGVTATRPIAVPVGVSGTTGSYELTITGDKTLINDGYTIVDDASGQIYRVLERLAPPLDDRIIRLDKPWRPDLSPQFLTGIVWVVPPPVGGGRYPCIAVYQKVMRF